MKQITQILKKDNFIPELGYIVIDKDGMMAYNGQIGVKFSRKIAGERLCLIADENGAYAIPDPQKFLKIVSALDNIELVELNKKSSSIKIKFAGKGVVKIPVVLDLHSDTPHLNIKWKNMEQAKKEGIALTSLWTEVSTLITQEGEALWGDVIGVYGNNGQLVSFDYGVYIHSEDIKAPKFYCPRSLIDLGLRNLEFAVVSDDTVQLVGNDAQYICTGVSESAVVTDMMALKESFAKGENKKVTLDFTSGLWRRAKLFADVVLKFEVKDGQIFISHDNWSECIGKTEAPNAEFVTRISLLERWASGTFEHAISVNKGSDWNLYGKTRGGMHFYAVLTDLGIIPEIEEEIENPIESDVVSEEIDLPEGQSLI